MKAIIITAIAAVSLLTACTTPQPKQLDVPGLTQAECDHWGGHMVGTTCEDVDQ